MRRDRSPEISPIRQPRRSVTPLLPAPRPAKRGKTSRASNNRSRRLDQRIATLHEQMTAAASDYQQLAELQREMELITASKDDLEHAWLEAAEIAG